MSVPSLRVGKAVLVLLVATVVFVVGSLGTARAVTPFELWVVFNANHTISVAFDDGTPVGSLTGTGAAIPPGSYTLHFDDSVGVEGPDFDLRGPGVSLQEDMFFGESPSATHRVSFAPSSTYTWRDVEQPATVFTFTTSAAAPSTGASTGTVSAGSSTTPSTTAGGSSSTSQDIVGSAILPFRGALTGAVSAAGKLSLAFGGKTVASLKQGRYAATVTDRSRKAGFILELLGKNGSVSSSITVSKAPSVGRHKANVTLRKGQWVYVPSGGGRKTYFVVTA